MAAGPGRRRQKPMDTRRTGWGTSVREKASPYAANYAYEVRLPHANRWPLAADPMPYAELLDAVRRSTDCRVVGTGPFTGDTTGVRVWSVRVYLKTEADLFQMRLLTNDVFRVYKLKAP